MKYLITDTIYNQVELILGENIAIIKRWRASKASDWESSVTIFNPAERLILYGLLGKSIKGELK